MPTTVKKILMPILCIAIIVVIVLFYFALITFWPGVGITGVCMLLSPYVALGKWRDDTKFLRGIPFYNRLAIALFAVVIFLGFSSGVHSVGVALFFLILLIFANAIFYTVELYQPGVLSSGKSL